ncbi:MAG TPA: hypothetical protein VMH39_10370, partial [Gemmatimonadaceae bacterium]|nr:hypothetical protein [Gemmatimonadaceae bacterium]
MRFFCRFAVVLGLLPGVRAGAQVPDSATLAGFRYRAIGPVNMGSRITDIAADPHNSKILYIAAATGGIWKTVNAGTTFFPLWEHEDVASMGAIAIAPSNTQIIWAGTGESNARNSASPGRGIYKSTDGGISWTLMGLEKTQHIGRIVIDPLNPDIVYVAAIGDLWNDNPERGLYKTVDGGKTWQLSKFISDKAGFVDILMDPRDHNTLYAASWERVRKVYALKSGGPGSGLWKTTDAGKTWHEITGGGFPATPKGRIGLALAASNPNIVYALVEADSIRGAKPQRLLSGLYRSADAGKTWTWMSTTDNRPFYFSQIRVDPKNPNRVYRMAIDFQFSDDGGHSWMTGMVGNHEDYHAMWIDPNDPEHYIIGGDAGIFQTWDRGGTYDALNQMPIAQFYNISFDYEVPYRVCGGMQDNGTSCGISRRRSGTLEMDDWFAVNSADGFHTAQDWSDPNIIYYESQGGAMTRRNLFTDETASIKPHTAAVSTYGRQIEQIMEDTGGGPLPGVGGGGRGGGGGGGFGGGGGGFGGGAGGGAGAAAQAGAPGAAPVARRPALTPEQKKEQADQIRARMKEDMANPNSAQRWNWNTPFLLSQFDPNVFYSGSERVFKSVEKGDSPFAISGDLSTQDADRLRMANGYDADGNVAPDPSGGITNDAAAWLAEQNGTVVSLAESPMRA